MGGGGSQLKSKECRGEAENRKGRYWGVLCARWNGETRVRGHNICTRRGGKRGTWCRQGVRGSDEVRGIRLDTLNIRLGRASGLEAALNALKQGNVDVSVL